MIAILEIVVGAVVIAWAVRVLAATWNDKYFFLIFMIPVVIGFLGLAHLIIGLGVLRLRTWARGAQVALSCVGLLVSSLGLLVGRPTVGGAIILNGVILFYFLMPGMRVLFSGRPVSAMTEEEIRALGVLQKSGAGVAIALIAVLVGQIILMRVLDPLSGSARFKVMQAWMHRARSSVASQILGVRHSLARRTSAGMRLAARQTAADMRSLAAAWEARATDFNTYFVPGQDFSAVWEIDSKEVTTMLTPTYIRIAPTSDGWGYPLRFRASTKTYQIISAGKDGVFEATPAGPTTNFNCDMVFSVGKFVSYPEGIDVQ